MSNSLIMKKFISLFVLLFTSVMLSAEEQPITFSELPKNAKVFVLTYFKDIPIKEICIERRASLTQYEMKLKGGIDLQFDRVGMCTEIEYEKGSIPSELIPKKIKSVVDEHFPQSQIRKFEHNGRMYEIELDNSFVLTFSNTQRLLDIDK